MIFEQLFDTKSSTYTYIISSGKGREALIIDPVIEHTDEYIKVLEKLELKLAKVIDTHIHADHITGLNELHKRTSCTRIMGEKSKSEVIDIKIKDNEKINVENIATDIKHSIIKNLKSFENFSKEEIYDHRKAKFLQIGRDQGFNKSTSLEGGGLSYMEPNFQKFLSHIDKNKLIYGGLGLLAVTSLIVLLF